MARYLARIPTPRSTSMSMAYFLENLQGLGAVFDVSADYARVLIDSDDEWTLSRELYDLGKELGVEIERPAPAPDIFLLMPSSMYAPPNRAVDVREHLVTFNDWFQAWNSKQHVHLSPMVDWETIRTLAGFMMTLVQGMQEGEYGGTHSSHQATTTRHLTSRLLEEVLRGAQLAFSASAARSPREVIDVIEELLIQSGLLLPSVSDDVEEEPTEMDPASTQEVLERAGGESLTHGKKVI